MHLLTFLQEEILHVVRKISGRQDVDPDLFAPWQYEMTQVQNYPKQGLTELDSGLFKIKRLYKDAKSNKARWILVKEWWTDLL